MAQEGAAHAFVVLEAALARDLGNAGFLRDELLLGDFDAHGFDRLGGRHAEAAGEDAGEEAEAIEEAPKPAAKKAAPKKAAAKKATAKKASAKKAAKK